MPIEFGLWRVDGDLRRVHSSSIDSEQRLEDLLEKDLTVLDLGLMLMGRQVPTAYGKFIDLLAINPEGEIYVIELKKHRTPREIVAQLLDYGSWIQSQTFDEIVQIYQANHPGQDLHSDFAEMFGQSLPDALNESHRLVIVASELDASTERIVEYLSENFGVPLNAVFFRYFDDGGHQYLARSWLLDPAEAEANTSRATGKKEPWNGRDFYISFGDGPSRSWEDARTYGFISAGGGDWYTRTLRALQPGHRVFVHIPGSGYVGVGEVTEGAVPIANFMIQRGAESTPIAEAPLNQPGLLHDLGDTNSSEHVVKIEWTKTLDASEALWEKGFFANQNSAVKLRNQFTLRRLIQLFNLDG